MIDTHMHADARSGEDFEKMFLAGIDTAITCSYYPYKIPHEMILLNHLNRILELDTKRAMEHGLELKVALGIHPTNSNVNPEIIFDASDICYAAQTGAYILIYDKTQDIRNCDYLLN